MLPAGCIFADVVKQALIALLIVATLLPTVSPWGTIAYYQLNRAYIARVLCVNRNRPQLHCNGQCFLARRLRQRQARQDQETTEQLRQLPQPALFCQRPDAFVFGPVVHPLVSTPVFSYARADYSAPSYPPFRPPRLQTA
ncbi:hypothetical protein GCM10027578_29590 [Spirosoma luteolum]